MFGISMVAVANVLIVWGVTQLVKRYIKWHPVTVSWVVAGVLVAVEVAVELIFFPGELALDGIAQTVVGVFAVQGGVKNVQVVMGWLRGRMRAHDAPVD